VISVQTIVLSLESLQIRRNHNWLKSLSFFFSPALRKFGRIGSRRSGSRRRSLRPCFDSLALSLAAPYLFRGGYAGDKLRKALKRIGEWTLEIIKRSDAARGFEVLPRRWVVERTFA
jgi:transposase